MLGGHCFARNAFGHDGDDLITCQRAVLDQSRRHRLNAGTVFRDQIGRFGATEREKQLDGLSGATDDGRKASGLCEIAIGRPWWTVRAQKPLTLRTAQQIDAAATHMRVDFAGIQYGFAVSGHQRRI